MPKDTPRDGSVLSRKAASAAPEWPKGGRSANAGFSYGGCRFIRTRRICFGLIPYTSLKSRWKLLARL